MTGWGATTAASAINGSVILGAQRHLRGCQNRSTHRQPPSGSNRLIAWDSAEIDMPDLILIDDHY